MISGGWVPDRHLADGGLGDRGDLRRGQADIHIGLEKILTMPMPGMDWLSTCSTSFTVVERKRS